MRRRMSKCCLPPGSPPVRSDAPLPDLIVVGVVGARSEQSEVDAAATSSINVRLLKEQSRHIRSRDRRRNRRYCVNPTGLDRSGVGTSPQCSACLCCRDLLNRADRSGYQRTTLLHIGYKLHNLRVQSRCLRS